MPDHTTPTWCCNQCWVFTGVKNIVFFIVWTLSNLDLFPHSVGLNIAIFAVAEQVLVTARECFKTTEKCHLSNVLATQN